MFKSKTLLLIASLAFVVVILVVSIWIIKNHSGTVEEKELITATKAPATQVNKIILERNECYGTCPSYKLTINSDDSVIFEGRNYVKEKRIIKSTISREKLQQLVEEFEKADYLSLKDRYEGVGDGCATFSTDNPVINTSITIGGQSKSIRHNYGCWEEGESYVVYPQALFNLEKRIDEIVGTAQWIK